MGAIGTGPFENDSAIDWLIGASGKGFPSSFDAAVPLDDKAVERSTTVAEEAIAAIAVLAFAITKDSDIGKVLSRLDIKHKDMKTLAKPERIEKAAHVLAQLQKEDSTIREEWQDSGLLKQWESQLAKLVQLITKS